MDPQAALFWALDDLYEARNPKRSEQNRQEIRKNAAELLRGLAHWLDNGGFAPVVVCQAFDRNQYRFSVAEHPTQHLTNKASEQRPNHD